MIHETPFVGALKRKNSIITQVLTPSGWVDAKLAPVVTFRNYSKKLFHRSKTIKGSSTSLVGAYKYNTKEQIK